MYPESTTAPIAKAYAETSAAVSSFAWGTPGPLPVWHKAHAFSIIGRISFPKEIRFAVSSPLSLSSESGYGAKLVSCFVLSDEIVSTD